MQSLLSSESRNFLCDRVDRLGPDAPASWGKFTAPGMLAHLIQSLRMMNGALVVTPEPAPWLLSHAPLKHLLIYVLPFPRGMSTFPELLARPAASCVDDPDHAWSAEKMTFRAELEAIGARNPAGEWPRHGAFGPLTGQEWGVLQYRHIHHHLRQFRC